MTFAVVALAMAASATIHWATPACPGLAMRGDVVIRSDATLTGTIYANGKIVGDDKGTVHSVSITKSKAPDCGGKDVYIVVVKGSFLQSGISHVDEVDLMFPSRAGAEKAKRTIECTALHMGCLH